MSRFIKFLKTFLIDIIDYLFCLVVFSLCFVIMIIALPWIIKQRKNWENTCRGSHKALILLPLNIEKLMNRGYEHLLSFQNKNLHWIGILDARNSKKTYIKIADNFYLITFKSPRIVKIFKQCGFYGTSIIIREFTAVFKITRYCINNHIGIIRAIQHHYPALQACLVSHAIKIPFIVDIAGNYELIYRLSGKAFYFKRLFRIPFLRIFAQNISDWLLGWPMRNAFYVLGRNKNNYEHAFALGAPIDRLTLLRINNFGVSFNSYNPRKQPEKPVEYPYLLFVGRLSQEKFPLDVIDAFDLAARHFPKHHLVIIGDGILMNDIKIRREHSNYKDRIDLLGACSNDIVLNWTVHSKLAICPYSGATLVEAMLCGVPVIAYDIEWHAEIVIDDYTGYLVPFRNIPALTSKLIYVLQNHESAKIVGERGRDLAKVAFDQERISKKESLLYLDALEGQSENL